ncbi:hypothetical protein N7462_010713 [Penicillium macrosclerotiorum]|uniref:uncharacterized protein n=1 Tax=Penicillium macrosclerotiorum TaxID=303699 RepID=UPI0025465E94|nr:uncharacterized protein N7462_010713 [Penicillium macrosclerotiorum]KAJ5669643.1 hypothetical protein N7462_010713 [Penicillium macrosclerotiorum]
MSTPEHTQTAMISDTTEQATVKLPKGREPVEGQFLPKEKVIDHEISVSKAILPNSPLSPFSDIETVDLSCFEPPHSTPVTYKETAHKTVTSDTDAIMSLDSEKKTSTPTATSPTNTLRDTIGDITVQEAPTATTPQAHATSESPIAESVSRIDNAVSGDPFVGRSQATKSTKVKASPFKGDPTINIDSLPKPEEELNDAQISILCTQSKEIRKKYGKYFCSTGIIRSAYYGIIFARKEDGTLQHSEDVLNSNVPRWESRLLYHEDPRTWTSKGEPRQRSHGSPAKRKVMVETLDQGESKKVRFTQNLADNPEPSAAAATGSRPCPVHLAESPAGQQSNNRIAPGDPNYLLRFVSWLGYEIFKLNHYIMDTATMTKDIDYQNGLIEVLIRSQKLRSACISLQGHLRKNQQVEE